jgi:hypothetical protein
MPVSQLMPNRDGISSPGAQRLRAGMRSLVVAIAASWALAVAAQDRAVVTTDAFDYTVSTSGAVADHNKISPDGWLLSISPYTLHFHPSDEHEYPYAIGLIKLLPGNWIVGGSYFSNSFGQPSTYVYVGQRSDSLFGSEKWCVQWNAGLLYGYVDEYEDKVPLNYNGFSPGFVPGIGYRFNDRVYGELDLLGNSALSFTLNFPITW